MTPKPSTSRHRTCSRSRGPRERRPHAHLAHVLLPLFVLAIVLLPGCGPSSSPTSTPPCGPGEVCPALVVPGCSIPPGLTTPPTAPKLLEALPDSIVAATAGGPLPGIGSVSATGEYQYRIPIEVPAGRAGVQPSLALVYGSRTGNGHLGVGWQLEGLSEINRCAKTFATEGYADGVSFDAKDTFCLDGRKLIAVQGSYGGDGTEYRTEEDTFARIVSHTGPHGQVVGFEVRTKEGRIRTYASPEPVVGFNEAISWPLQEEHDRSGNALWFTYERQGAPGRYPLSGGGFIEYYPSRIDYTRAAKDGPGTGPRSVRFEYETRDDITDAYVHGVDFKTTLRLKSIVLDAPNPVTPETVWRYDLSYEPSPGSGRSRLTAAQRCGVNHDGTKGGCFDAKQFTWNQDPRGPTYAKEAVYGGALDTRAFVGDFNGDGRAEILHRDGSLVRFTVDPEHPLSEQCIPSGLVPGTFLGDAKLADVFGDGRTRLLAALGPAYFVVELSYTASTTPGGALGCEFSYAPFAVAEVNVPGLYWPIHVTDLDGDGLPDLIKAETSDVPGVWNWHYRLNAPQIDPTLAWTFGPSHVAPFSAPPAREGLTSLSFSTDTGTHRGVIFPAVRYNASTGAQLPRFYGFGLGADGTPFATDTDDLHLDWFPDTNFAAFGDTNGDGIRNPVGYLKPLEDKLYQLICLENICADQLVDDLDLSQPAEWRVETADLDSDGQDEMLLIHTTGEREVAIFRLNAKGKIERSDAPFRAPTAIGDFNGDGLLDVIVAGDSTSKDDNSHPATVYRQTGVGTVDRIVAVNNAGDTGDTDPSARETIVYSNAQLPDVGPACKYPQRCMKEGFAVVQEHDDYQGADVATSGAKVRRTLFTYEDPRFDVRGRGFLGFGTVRSWDAARAAETITTYDNATSDDNGLRLVYPGALKPKSVLRAVPMDANGQAKRRSARLARTDYAYELVRLNQGATYFVHPASWGSLEWEEDVEIDYGDAARVHITGIDGVGEKGALRERKGSSHYDEYGNEIDAQVETVGGVRSSVVSTYGKDTSTWLIGQLTTTDEITSEHGQPAPAARHHDYDYDPRGLLCHVYTEKGHPSAEIPELVTFTHDSEGLVTAVTTSAVGQPLRTVHMAYEPTERVYPVETWNDLGQGSWSLYDPARGVALATEDANGLQAHARYDDLSRLVQAAPEGGSQVNVSYAPRLSPGGSVIGTSVRTDLGTGSASRVDQDLLGRTVGRGHRGFDGSWIEEATSYDALGRVVARTRPDVNAPSKHATQLAYDNLDRLLAETKPGGETVTYEHTFSTSLRSDTFTDRETVRDVDGRVIQSVDDARNARLTTTFLYGAFNQLEHVVDSGGNTTTIHYDQRGRRTSLSDPDSGLTSFTYDGFGEVVTRTAGGAQTIFTHDLLGRLTQTSHAGELTVNTWDTHGPGRLAHTLSPDKVEQDFKYNALGQLDTLTYRVDGEDFDFQMAYDGSGRVVNLAYPKVPGQAQRFSIGQAYMPWGHLGAVYDPTSITYAPYWRVDARNAEDQLTHATLGDGTVGIRGYEPDTGLLASVSEGQALALSYGYYPDGSLASRQDTLADREETFAYDGLHRLSTWGLKKSPEIGYRYDDLGNLTEVWSKPTPWSAGTLQEKNTYGTNGKPHALMQGPRGSYTYDARGRQDTAPGRSLVTYNENDLPRKITTSPGSDTLFAYDASGTRIKKQSLTETLLTLGGLYERRTTAGHVEHVFYVPGGDEGPIARIVVKQGEDLTKAKPVYLHHDPLLGSVAAVTDAGGDLKESFYYEPFGQRIGAQGKPLASPPAEVGSGFTGHEHDEDLGLINMRGRVYDPLIRRFLSPDPHVTNPLSGQSYNRYSYVLNNPANLIDPTGFDCIGQECSGEGTEYSPSSGFASSPANDYSGAFFHADPSGLSGFSGSAVGGSGLGAPVQAAERLRLISMPVGPAAPAGAISGPAVKAGSDGNKWNPYTDEGRLRLALLGSEKEWQDPLEPYKPMLGSMALSFIPGVNSYMVFNNPEASTAGKMFAVGSDVLAVVGVSGVIKFAKAGATLIKGVASGAEVAEGLEVARAYSVAFETQLAPEAFKLNRMRHFSIANQALEEARAASPELAQLVPPPRGWGKAPPGWVWQHATIEQGAGRAGILQLVPKAQHTPGSPFWRLLHPLPNGGGGYTQWAIPAGADPN